jgi:hypothetical protein
MPSLQDSNHSTANQLPQQIMCTLLHNFVGKQSSLGKYSDDLWWDPLTTNCYKEEAECFLWPIENCCKLYQWYMHTGKVTMWCTYVLG